MMKKLILLSIISTILLGCNESKFEQGQSLEQLETKVDVNKAKYLKEMQYIFSNYDLVLYDTQSVRSSDFFYFIERIGFFDNEIYLKEVRPRLAQKGWVLVEKNNFSELFCKQNQAIGVTFPTYKKEMDGVNTGYFTYQFYKKVSITLNYTTAKNNISCVVKD